MRFKIIIWIAPLFVLSACSDAPSDDDAKQVVQSFLGGCPYLSLDRFKKLNGIAVGNGRHDVQVLYTIKTSPIPGAKEIAAETATKQNLVDAKIAEAEANQKKHEDVIKAYEAKISKAEEVKDPVLKESLLVEKINYGNAQVTSNERELDTLRREKREIVSSAVGVISSRLSKDCSNVNPIIQVYEYGNVEQYGKAFTKDFTATIPLFKTDNGWQAAL